MHLGDPEAVSDLGLREVVLEAQSEDDALAVGERVEQSVDECGVLDAVEAGLVGGEEVDRVVAVVGERLVQRVGVVGGGGGECLEDLFGRRVGAVGEFGGVGERPSSLVSVWLMVSTRSVSSWRSRGTRTVQPWSRK